MLETAVQRGSCSEETTGPALRTTWPTFPVCALYAVVLTLGYWSVLEMGFVSEEMIIITHLLDGDGQLQWSALLEQFYSNHYNQAIRPLAHAAHGLVYAIAGPDATAFRVLNLILQFLNGILIHSIAAALAPGRRLLPIFCALLFYTYPMHPEAVTYFASFILCATFYLVSLRLFIEFLLCNNVRWFIGSLFAFLAALLTKEEAVSLPFAVAWIAFFFFGWPSTKRKHLRIVLLAAPFVSLLALYFGFRFVLFGQLVPKVYSEWDVSFIDFIEHLPRFLYRMFTPINDLSGSVDAQAMLLPLLIFYSTFAVLVSVLRRPPWRGWVFLSGVFLIFCIPVYKVIPQGIGPGLLNSRTAFFPSIALASILAWIAFGKLRDSRLHCRLALVASVSLVLVQIAILNLNNRDWMEASALTERLKSEARALTGNSANIEIVNLPDTHQGVLFDRGGFSRAFVYPFVPDNFHHRRQRVVTLSNHGNAPIRLLSRSTSELDLRIGDTNALRELAPGESRTITVRFDPEVESRYEGALFGTSRFCPEEEELVRVVGAGLDSPPTQTYLTATAVRLDARGTDKTIQFTAAIAAAETGQTAKQVAVSLLEGTPATVDYNFLGRDGGYLPVNRPYDLASGESAHILISVTPYAGMVGRPLRLALRFRGINTPVVPIDAHTTMFEIEKVSSGVSEESAPLTNSRAFPRRQPCNSVHVQPALVDFGVVPTAPTRIRMSDSPEFFGTSVHRIFWDDLANRVLPYAVVRAQPSVLDWFDERNSSWTNGNNVWLITSNPPFVALAKDRPVGWVEIGGLNLDPNDVAYMLVRMRVQNATNPYMHLAWRTDEDPDFTAGNVIAGVTVPDGLFHVYALPLHSHSAWRSSRRIRRLRFSPTAVSGWTEIAELRMIGPIP